MRPIFVLFLLSLALVATARAADSDRHWTTNGVHKGIISHTENGSRFDPNGFVGSFTVSYMLETLMQEPVEDTIFNWKWPEGYAWDSLEVGNATVDGKTVAVRVSDLQKYPDLLEAFRGMKPLSIELNLHVEFLGQNRVMNQGFHITGADNTHLQWERISYGSKTIKPIVIGQAGEKTDSIVPGSPKWEDWFQLNFDRRQDDYSSDPKARARWNKETYRKAERVELTFDYPAVKSIQWMGLVSWETLLRKYGERESKPVIKTNQVAQATNAPAKPKLATKPNPFEQAAGKTNVAPNPFEQANDKPSSAPNPFEAANSGNVRSKPENPFEKDARLKAEEFARKEAIRLEEEQKAEARKAEERDLQERLFALQKKLAGAVKQLQDFDENPPQRPTEPSMGLWLTAAGADPGPPESLVRTHEANMRQYRIDIAAYNARVGDLQNERNRLVGHTNELWQQLLKFPKPSRSEF